MSHLNPVHGTTNKDRIGDVVFVHGLGGDAREYWRSGTDDSTFWPAWLADEDGFSNVAIWSLGYAAAPFHRHGEAMPLYANANNALDLLALHNIGSRPLVFVTHSLGGLLVKKMLQNAVGLKVPAWRDLANHTRGIAFIATPHSGSSLATYVSYIGWLLGASISVSELNGSSVALAELNSWYRENIGFDSEGELPVHSIVYYEESRTRSRWFKLWGVIVVDRASADPGIKHVVPIGITRDHRTIHKPPDRRDQVYLGVKRHIQECLLPGFLASPPAAWSSPLVGNVPVPPPGFLPRTAIDAEVVAILRDKTDVSGAVTICALQGIPGAGKTTIAANLARTLSLLQMFPDGVLWLTLGPQPSDLRDMVAGLIQTFNRTYQPRELQTTLGRLKELLRPKRCLLVLDDVWDPAHARPLLPDGSGSKVLITTRDVALARELGARLFSVGVLTPAEALTLLSRRTDGILSGADEAAAREIATDLGFHPLALHLAAAQIVGGAGWSELRDCLRDEATRLDVLESTDESWSLDEQRTRSVLASFELSARRLDSQAREMFAWLGVLTATSLWAEFLTTLWSVDSATADRRLRQLAGKGLLAEVSSRTATHRLYNLHALLRGFARRLVPRTLGCSLKIAHGLLLDRYRANASGAEWFDIADDHYLYDHLAWHLEQAERTEEMFGLLGAETADGNHQWYAACERQGRSAAFLTFVRDAGRFATERYQHTKRSEDVEVMFRCLLLASTSNSVAVAVRSELLIALVKAGMWSLDQALTRVRQLNDRYIRTWGLVSLIEHFSQRIGDDVRLEALEALPAVEEPDRYEMLAHLAPHLVGRPSMIEAAVALLRGAEVEPRWIICVSAIRRLAAREAITSLEASRTVDTEESWIRWFAVVRAPLIGVPLAAALECAQQISFPHQRALALMSLAETLPEQPVALIDAAIQSFGHGDPQYGRSEVIKAIAPYATLLGSLMTSLWKAEHELFLAGPADTRETVHADSIVVLAPYLVSHESVIDEALAAAREFGDPAARGSSLGALLQVAGGSRRAEIVRELDALANTADSVETAISASALETRRDEMLRHALRLSTAPDDQRVWLAALNWAIRSGPTSEQPGLVRRVMLALPPAHHSAISGLAALTELLPEREREEAMVEMRAAASALPPERKARTLAVLASLSTRSRDVVIGEFLATIDTMPVANRGELLGLAIRVVTTDIAWTQRVVGILHDLPPTSHLVHVAQHVLPACSEEERIALVRPLTARLMNDDLSSWSESDLTALVAFSANDPPSLRLVVDSAPSVRDVATGIRLTLAVARLSFAEQAPVEIEACWARTQSAYEHERVRLRSEILPLLPNARRADAFAEAWDDAGAQSDPIDRAAERGRLLAHAPAHQRQMRIADLLTALSLPASEAHHEDYQAGILFQIAKYIDKDPALIARLETHARAMRDPTNRAYCLESLLRHLAGGERESVFDAAVEAAHQIERLDYRSRIFAEFLLPACPPARRAALLVKTLRILIKARRMEGQPAAQVIAEVAALSDDALLWTAWDEVQEELADQPRATVLDFISACGPVLDRLFGQEGAAAISRALLDIGRWFPPSRSGPPRFSETSR